MLRSHCAVCRSPQLDAFTGDRWKSMCLSSGLAVRPTSSAAAAGGEGEEWDQQQKGKEIIVMLQQNYITNELSSLRDHYDALKCNVRWVSSVVMNAEARTTLPAGMKVATLTEPAAADSSSSSSSPRHAPIALGPFPSSLIRFSNTLSGYLLCSTALSKASNNCVKLWTQALGARLEAVFTGETTHLVAAKAMSPKYRAAVRLNIPVVTHGWVESCFRHGVRLDPLCCPEWRVKPMVGACVACIGLDAEAQEQVRTQVEEAGGAFMDAAKVEPTLANLSTQSSPSDATAPTLKFFASRQLTHIICASWPAPALVLHQAPKFKVLLQNTQWLPNFLDSAGGLAEDSTYALRSPEDQAAFDAQRAKEEAERLTLAEKKRLEKESAERVVRQRAEAKEKAEREKAVAEAAAAEAALQAALAAEHAAQEAQRRALADQQPIIEYDEHDDSYLSGLKIFLFAPDTPAQLQTMHNIILAGGGTRLSSIAGRESMLQAASSSSASGALSASGSAFGSANFNINSLVLVYGAKQSRESLDEKVRLELSGGANAARNSRRGGLTSLAIPVVNHHWLIKCYDERSVVDFAPFLIPPAPTAATPNGLMTSTSNGGGGFTFGQQPALQRTSSINAANGHVRIGGGASSPHATMQRALSAQSRSASAGGVFSIRERGTGGGAGPADNSMNDDLTLEQNSLLQSRASKGGEDGPSNFATFNMQLEANKGGAAAASSSHSRLPPSGMSSRLSSVSPVPFLGGPSILSPSAITPPPAILKMAAQGGASAAFNGPSPNLFSALRFVIEDADPEWDDEDDESAADAGSAAASNVDEDASAAKPRSSRSSRSTPAAKPASKSKPAASRGLLLKELRFTTKNRLHVIKALKDCGAPDSMLHTDWSHRQDPEVRESVNFVVGGVTGSNVLRMKGPAAFESLYGKRAVFVSWLWVDKSMKSNKLMPSPASTANPPSPFLCGTLPPLGLNSSPITSFAALYIATSGFSADEIAFLKCVTLACGGKFNEKLSVANTHLICNDRLDNGDVQSPAISINTGTGSPAPDASKSPIAAAAAVAAGPGIESAAQQLQAQSAALLNTSKRMFARRRNIPILRAEWLFDCIKQRFTVPVEPYLLEPIGTASARSHTPSSAATVSASPEPPPPAAAFRQAALSPQRAKSRANAAAAAAAAPIPLAPPTPLPASHFQAPPLSETKSTARASRSKLTAAAAAAAADDMQEGEIDDDGVIDDGEKDAGEDDFGFFTGVKKALAQSEKTAAAVTRASAQAPTPRASRSRLTPSVSPEVIDESDDSAAATKPLSTKAMFQQKQQLAQRTGKTSTAASSSLAGTTARRSVRGQNTPVAVEEEQAEGEQNEEDEHDDIAAALGAEGATFRAASKKASKPVVSSEDDGEAELEFQPVPARVKSQRAAATQAAEDEPAVASPTPAATSKKAGKAAPADDASVASSVAEQHKPSFRSKKGKQAATALAAAEPPPPSPAPAASAAAAPPSASPRKKFQKKYGKKSAADDASSIVDNVYTPGPAAAAAAARPGSGQAKAAIKPSSLSSLRSPSEHDASTTTKGAASAASSVRRRIDMSAVAEDSPQFDASDHEGDDKNEATLPVAHAEADDFQPGSQEASITPIGKKDGRASRSAQPPQASIAEEDAGSPKPVASKSHKGKKGVAVGRKLRKLHQDEDDEEEEEKQPVVADTPSTRRGGRTAVTPVAAPASTARASSRAGRGRKGKRIVDDDDEEEPQVEQKEDAAVQKVASEDDYPPTPPPEPEVEQPVPPQPKSSPPPDTSKLAVPKGRTKAAASSIPAFASPSITLSRISKQPSKFDEVDDPFAFENSQAEQEALARSDKKQKEEKAAKAAKAAAAFAAAAADANLTETQILSAHTLLSPARSDAALAAAASPLPPAVARVIASPPPVAASSRKRKTPASSVAPPPAAAAVAAIEEAPSAAVLPSVTASATPRAALKGAVPAAVTQAVQEDPAPAKKQRKGKAQKIDEDASVAMEIEPAPVEPVEVPTAPVKATPAKGKAKAAAAPTPASRRAAAASAAFEPVEEKPVVAVVGVSSISAILSPPKRSMSTKAAQSLATLKHESEDQEDEEMPDSKKLKQSKKKGGKGKKKSAIEEEDEEEDQATDLQPSVQSTTKKAKLQASPATIIASPAVVPKKRGAAAAAVTDNVPAPATAAETPASKGRKLKRKAQAEEEDTEEKTEQEQKPLHEPASKRLKSGSNGATAAAAASSSPPASVSSKKSTKHSQPAASASPSSSRPVFCLSGVSSVKKCEYEAAIKSLGCELIQADNLTLEQYERVTHIVAAATSGKDGEAECLKRSEKVLVGMVAGIPVVTPQFLFQASEQGSVPKDCSKDEWANHPAATSKDQRDPLAAALRHWHPVRLAAHGRPFTGWRVWADPPSPSMGGTKPQEVWDKLLRLGGSASGLIEDFASSAASEPITHALFTLDKCVTPAEFVSAMKSAAGSSPSHSSIAVQASLARAILLAHPDPSNLILARSALLVEHLASAAKVKLADFSLVPQADMRKLAAEIKKQSSGTGGGGGSSSSPASSNRSKGAATQLSEEEHLDASSSATSSRRRKKA